MPACVSESALGVKQAAASHATCGRSLTQCHAGLQVLILRLWFLTGWFSTMLSVARPGRAKKQKLQTVSVPSLEGKPQQETSFALCLVTPAYGIQLWSKVMCAIVLRAAGM